MQKHIILSDFSPKYLILLYANLFSEISLLGMVVASICVCAQLHLSFKNLEIVFCHLTELIFQVNPLGFPVYKSISYVSSRSNLTSVSF
jgi:hypothetical protein